MRVNRLTATLASVLVGALLCLAALAAATLAGSAPVSAETVAVRRPHDPVIVTGSQLAEFDGTPVDELVLLARVSGAWQPIPFQVDEVTASGEYTTTEDGLLDDNDELVFMGYDAGEQAAPDEWVTDTEARLNPRYAIAISDPLAPGDVAHAYLHRSSTLERASAVYVGFDHPTQVVTAMSYTMAFSPTSFIGISDLAVNGHDVDILDRQKLRSMVSGLINDTLTEEGLVEYAGAQTLTLPIVGPVRAVSERGMSFFAFYASRIDVLMDMPLSEQVPPFSSIDQARVSFDWRDPGGTGMAPSMYFDSNTPAGVSADGASDTISDTPPLAWFQYQGALGGAVFVLEIEAGEDVVSNYYKDDDTVDEGDTGDQMSFADAGIIIDKSGETLGDLVLTETTYILPGGTGNLGDTAEQWVATPLVASASLQRFLPHQLFVPFVVRD